jgi:Transposase
MRMLGNKINTAKRTRFDIANVVFYMVCKHILEPDSKLGMYESQDKYLKLPELNLNHFYRALDVLADAKADIEGYLFEQNRTIFNMSIDVVFCDVTIFYFESKDEDLLRRFGFSKDGKVNDVQIVLGLLVDKEGRPVGYDIFAGNTFDGKTLEPFLLRLKERFSIQRIIIVADRGINSKMNLMRIRELGYGYIVACRLKGMSKEIKGQVFTDEGYRSIDMDEEVFKYKIIGHQNRVRNDRGIIQDNEDNP